MREYKGIVSGEDVPALMKKKKKKNGCQHPECPWHEDGEHETNELYLSQVCHPGAGFSVLVLAPDHPHNPTENPIAIIKCRECGKHVGSILIGFEGEPGSGVF